jgi:hypothetical protein
MHCHRDDRCLLISSCHGSTMASSSWPTKRTPGSCPGVTRRKSHSWGISVTVHLTSATQFTAASRGLGTVRCTVTEILSPKFEYKSLPLAKAGVPSNQKLWISKDSNRARLRHTPYGGASSQAEGFRALSPAKPPCRGERSFRLVILDPRAVSIVKIANRLSGGNGDRAAQNANFTVAV